jgi:isoleucyl-tRNA synthetase
LATGLKNKPAFKNVIVNGIVVAEDGKKMSKKLKNYPDPAMLFDKYGADALRYYLLTSPVVLAENLNFSEKGVLESVRKVNMILWNVYKFYELFASDGEVILPCPVGEGRGEGSGEENVLDKWIRARLNQLIVEVTKGMHEYNLPKATRPIIDFIDVLSTWYIRRSRDRFKGDDVADAKNALATTKHILLELSKLMAPFIPFIAEQIWQKVSGYDFGDVNQSVHLENWPKANKVDERDLIRMGTVRKFVEAGLAKRDEFKIKIRQPLTSVTFLASDFESITIKDIDVYLDLIKDELNVKEVFIKKGKEFFAVELDIKITPELKQEGVKRELVRNINSLRKDANLSIGDSAEIYYETESEELKIVLEKYAIDIMNDTLGKAIKFGVEYVEQSKEFKIEGGAIKLGVKKI